MNSKTEPISKREREALEWYESFIFAMLFLGVVFSFLFRIVLVDGTSMVPTLQNGDRLIVWGAGYSPKNGDVVVVDADISYGKPLVKRVIAVGGDTVDINFETGVVSVNGVSLYEPYVAAPTYLEGDVSFPLTVEEGEVFLMGDNRNGSKDSRNSDIGCIREEDILGKVLLRLIPFSKMGIIS